MRRSLFVLSFTLALFASAAPFAYAANLPLLDPNFSIVPSECTSCPCGAGGALQLIQNLMNAGVSLGVVVITLVIAYAGFLFIMSPTNPENRSQARGMIINAIVGFVIVLAAWLLVDFIMKMLYDSSGNFGPWNKILQIDDTSSCIQPQAVGQISGLPGVISDLTNVVSGPAGEGGAGAGGATATVQGGGACRIPQSGNCAPSSLSMFGAAAQEASEICFAESKGVVKAVSGSDRMRNDPQRRAFSFGLFQINLTQHDVAGLNCPSAFNGKNYAATVKNEALYSQCVAAAETASANIAVALYMYQHGGWKQWSTASECRLAFTTSSRFAYAVASVRITFTEAVQSFL